MVTNPGGETPFKRLSYFYRISYSAFRLARQGGLRKKVVEVVKLSVQGDFDRALLLTQEYATDLKNERGHAEEAISSVQHVLSGDSPDTPALLKRKEVSDYLGFQWTL